MAFEGRQNLMPKGWAKTRARWLRANPDCVQCGRLAVTVDHIVARAFGGTDDPSNYQSLCDPCHKTKTAAEGNAAWAAKKAAQNARFDFSD